MGNTTFSPGELVTAAKLNTVNPSIIATGGSTARTLADRAADVVNVKDFGATGDGLTNDDSAFTAFFNHLETNGGNGYIPQGVFLISSHTITNPTKALSIYGAGKGVTILKKRENGASNMLQIEETTRNVIVENLTIFGDFATQSEGGHGLVFLNTSNAVARNLRISDVKSSGLIAYSSPIGTIHENIVCENVEVAGKGNTKNGIVLVDLKNSGMKGCWVDNVTEFGLELKESCQQSYIEDCFATKCGLTGIEFGQTSGTAPSNCRVSNCQIYASDQGIELSNGTGNFFNNITIDMNNAVGSVQGVINVSTNADDNVFSNIVALNVPAATPAIRYRAGVTGNTAHFSLIEKAGGGDLVQLDSGAQYNVTTIDQKLPYDTYIDDLISDDSTNDDNIVGYSQAADLIVRRGTTGSAALPVFTNGDGAPAIGITSSMSYRFEDKDKPVVLQLVTDETTGDSGIAVGGAASEVKGSFYYNIDGDYWRTSTGLRVYPTTTRPTTDNVMALGSGSYRYTTVYATTGAIDTSDLNEKQQISNLSEAESKVAAALKGLVKRFKFNDAVDAKGEGARWHVGVVAQDVKSAFEAEGLVAERYGMFCEDTWWTDSANEGEVYDEGGDGRVMHTRLGVRYGELLTFIIAAL